MNRHFSGGASEPVLPSFPEVSRVLAACTAILPQQGMKAIRRAFPSRSWKLVTSDAAFESNVFVQTADGATIAANPAQWAKDQAKAGHGIDAILARIKSEKLSFCKTVGTEKLYAVGSDAEDPLGFAQIRFCVETRLVYPSEKIEPWHLRAGYFSWDDADRSAPYFKVSPTDIVHSLGFLERCKRSCENVRREEVRALNRRVVRRRLPSGEFGDPIPYLEARPLPAGWLSAPGREERWFLDWQASSAGAQPLGRHWVMDTHDHVDSNGVQRVGFVPRPVIWPKRTIEAKRKSCHRLMDEISRFDTRVRCPMGWYFHMIYGNRVNWMVGERIAEGVQRGEIRLPARDEAVLLRWNADRYAF